MKIAFLGSRGIPGRYSGFETFYENLSTRLVERCHSVTVYNRSNYYEHRQKSYRGVRIVNLPTIKSKHLDTIFHTFLSTIHACFCNYDIVFYCTVGNSPLTFLPRIFGAKTFLSVDGADFQRAKWGKFARNYLKLTERLACICPNYIIADSTSIVRRYQSQFSKQTVYIPYGANTRIRTASNKNVLMKFGLEPDKYVLFVGRLVPENCAHNLIQAFVELNMDIKLVIVGDAPYSDDYKLKLKELANENVVFTGYLFEEDYIGISCNCRFFVLPSGIDGTRPVLLDQLGYGNCVLAKDVPATREVVGETAVLFKHDDDNADLREKLAMLLGNDSLIELGREMGQKRVRSYYSWKVVTDAFEALFDKALHGITENTDNFYNIYNELRSKSISTTKYNIIF